MFCRAFIPLGKGECEFYLLFTYHFSTELLVSVWQVLGLGLDCGQGSNLLFDIRGFNPLKRVNDLNTRHKNYAFY